MKRYLLILILIYLNQIAFSQSNAMVTFDEIAQVSVKTFDLEERTIINQHFYNSKWTDAEIVRSESNEEFKAMIKYDILNQQINILLLNQVMIASNQKISSFTFPQLGKKFIGLSPKNWRRGRVFFESLVEGKYTLLLFHEGIKQEPDYHPTLDMGSKDEKIIEKKTHYLLDNGKVYKIPSKKRAAIKFFNNYKKAAIYLKNHKVNFKKSEDLIKLFRIMND